MNTDKLIEFLNKYYGNNAEALVFGVGDPAFPSVQTNLSVLARKYNQFIPEPKDSDHADYVIIFDRCYELTLMGGINWQIDAIKKAGLMEAVDDYDFSAIIDPQILRHMLAPDLFTQRITELVEELELDVEECRTAHVKKSKSHKLIRHIF